MKQIIGRCDQKTIDYSGNPIVTFTAPDVAHVVTPMATQGGHGPLSAASWS